MATKKAPAKAKRRSPITREEGERRLVDATLELIRERQISEVGVRDIAERADVNHGFVHVWFGGKTPLLMRALERMLDQVAQRISAAPAGEMAALPFDEDVVNLIHLVMWITLESGTPPDMSRMHVIKALTDRYVEVEGLRPDVALRAAQQAVSFAVAAAMYGPAIGVTGNEPTLALFQQWRHTLGLLAKYPPA